MRLEARNLAHRYGDLEVLDGLSFAVGEGSVLAVVGPSGCGKSTLLRILGGLVAPDRGEVVARGEAPLDCLNPFTYVFQDFALLPWRTVAGNVALPLEANRLDAEARRERVRDALARCGLEEFAGAYPRQLSGGMQQRVGIARALAVKPAVLLMDEPLSALDSQTRDLLKEDLLRLWRETHATTVYVTHNLSEAAELADDILVLSRRPGRERARIPVGVPREERRRGDAVVLDVEERLWSLLRSEAAEAAREITA
ncbi:MAG TPA: ABC transporter ATP-binding protein [Thermoanaerobaculia bacterium]|nr:ABC transporter ATP-binding protein [Thermoanaerobaculia bacterium]